MKLLISLGAIAALSLAGCDQSDPKSAKDLAPKSSDRGADPRAVEQSYARPAGEMSELVAGVLQGFDLKLESDTRDDLGGRIVARRADGQQVTARITARDEADSEVSLRVAPGNRPLADLIHERIRQKLSDLEAK
jgi:hypothetical protein